MRSAVPVHRGARRPIRVVLAGLALVTVTTVSPSPADPASALTSVSDTGGDAVIDSLAPVTDAVGTGPVDVDAREVSLGDDGAARVPVAEAGSVHAVAVDPGVRMFGVSWSGSPAASVEVRTRTDGRWDAWQLLEADAADGEDVPSGRLGGSPVFIGGGAPWTASRCVSVTTTLTATAKDFIDRQSWDYLGQPASNLELWLGTAALHQGQSVGDYTAGVSRSHAVRTQLDPIPRLFRAGFGRDPSTASMVLWRNRFRSGQRPIHLAQAIIANPEGVRRYGHLANRPFVEQLYRDVLGRPGAPNWVDRHTASLDDRSRSRGDLLLEFAETKENRDRQEARVSTIVTYFAMLGRVPTDSLPRWQAEPLPVLAAAIIASPEWRSRPR